MTEDLVAVLGRTGPVLFDFDGPICSVFAGYPAPQVARRLVRRVAEMGRDVSAMIREQDPMEVLAWAAKANDHRVLAAVEEEFLAAEIKAIHTATPTPGSVEVIAAARRRSRAIAIVSNNSIEAIKSYLDSHNLASLIDVVVGRVHGEPNRMKPDPAPVLRAAEALASPVELCVLIGDSVTDMVSARRAGAASIGYANRPGKQESLAAAGADAIVTDMATIRHALMI